MPIPDMKETVCVETVNYRDSLRVNVLLDGGWAHHMQIKWFVLRYLKDRYEYHRDLNISNLKITGRSYAIIMTVE